MAYLAALDGVFLALADPTRRAVIGRLGRGPASVGDLAAPFDMALPSFMKHIRLLERHGLIRTEKQGRVRRCAIVPDKLEAARAWIDEQRAVWEARFDRLDQFLTDQDDPQ